MHEETSRKNLSDLIMSDFVIHPNRILSAHEALEKFWQPESFSNFSFGSKYTERFVNFPFLLDEIDSFLRLLLETSLHRVEAIDVTCGILFSVDDDDLSRFYPDQLPDWGFTYVKIAEIEAQSLSMERIRKYIVCTEGAQSFLLIQKNRHGALYKVGLLYLPMSLGRLDQSARMPAWFVPSGAPRDIDRFQDFVRRCLVARIENRSARFGTSRGWIGEIKDGRFTILDSLSNKTFEVIERSTDFYERVESINEKLTRWPETTKEMIYSLVTSSIERVINDIRFSSHGAILIFGCSATLDDTGAFFPGSINCSIPLGNLAYRSIMKADEMDYDGGNDGEHAADAHNRSVDESFRSALGAVLELSKTDGAVVFDKSMNCVGGGVFLKSSNVEGSPGGARHRSAKGFVSLVPGSIAICISQDGSVSFFR